MILFAYIFVGSNDECREKQEQIEEDEYNEKENENIKPKRAKKGVSNSLHL